MTKDDDVVDRADFLMQRRRSFVATPTPVQDTANAVATPVADEEDIPVLTEVLRTEEIAAPATTAATEAVNANQLAHLAADFSQAIEQRLNRILPGLIEASVASLEQDLRREILAATDAALKELAASYRQANEANR